MDDQVVLLQPGDLAVLPGHGAAGEDQAALFLLVGQREIRIAFHRHLALHQMRLAGAAVSRLTAERIGDAGVERRPQDGGPGRNLDGTLGLNDTDFEAHRANARICLIPKQSPFTTPGMGRPPVKPPASLDRGLLPSLLGYVLRRAQSAVFDDFANTFAKAGEALTPGEFGLLVLVDRNAGLSQMALARALGIDRSTLVPILDRLQERGLLMRHRSPTDGRTHALALTTAEIGRATSELQSPDHLVCRLLLEKKKKDKFRLLLQIKKKKNTYIL